MVGLDTDFSFSFLEDDIRISSFLYLGKDKLPFHVDASLEQLLDLRNLGLTLKSFSNSYSWAVSRPPLFALSQGDYKVTGETKEILDLFVALSPVGYLTFVAESRFGFDSDSYFSQSIYIDKIIDFATGRGGE